MKLRTHVVVRDPSTLLPVTFGPDDDVPEWAVALITMPGVWEGDEPNESADVTAGPTSNDMLALMTGASESSTRDELLFIANGLQLVAGEHFPTDASDAVILAAIRHRAEELRS
jgi:hypothetical protein